MQFLTIDDIHSMLYNFLMTRKIDCGEYIHWISDVLEKRTEMLLAKGGLTLSQMMVIESFRHSKEYKIFRMHYMLHNLQLVDL